MQEHHTSIVILDRHVTRLEQLCEATGLNRSAIIRQMIDSAQVIPAQVTTAVSPRPYRQRRATVQEKNERERVQQ